MFGRRKFKVKIDPALRKRVDLIPPYMLLEWAEQALLAVGVTITELSRGNAPDGMADEALVAAQALVVIFEELAARK